MKIKIESEVAYALLLCLSIKQEGYAIQLWLDSIIFKEHPI